MMPKPARWAVNPGMVAPSWRWAWRGLGFAAPFLEGNSSPLDVVSGALASTFSGVDWAVTFKGLAPSRNSTGDILAWSASPGAQMLGDIPFSVFVYLNATTYNGGFIAARDATSAGFWEFDMNDWGGANNVNFEFRTGAGQNTVTWAGAMSGLSLNEDTTFAISRLPGGTYELWINGVSKGTQSNATTPATTRAHDLYIGRRGNNADSVLGSYHCAYVWQRALSDDEHKLLARDPFGPIRPAGTLIVSLVEPSGTLHSGAGVANSSLQMVGAGTLTLILLYATADGTINSVVNEVDTTVNLYASVDDSPSSPTDTDWINNTAGTGSVFLDLTNMPSDFGTMDTLKLTVRWRGQTYIGNKSIYAQIFQSNETTSMSDEVLVATATGDSSFANTTQVTFTGLDTSSGKSVWDGARIRLRWA